MCARTKKRHPFRGAGINKKQDSGTIFPTGVSIREVQVFQREVPIQQGRVIAAVKEYDVGLFHQRGLGIARDADRLGPAGMGDLGHLDDFLADAGIGDKDGRVVVVER